MGSHQIPSFLQYPKAERAFELAMAPLSSLLKDINTSRTQWALKLRLIRCYNVPAFGNRMRIRSTECVFHDYEGQRIHASIRSDLLPRLNINLTEGSVFAVKNFVVTNNRMRYKTTNNRYMLIFINDTRVTEVFDATFPKQMFDFKSFEEVANAQQLNETEMFDIIGRIVTVNQPQMRNNNDQETRWMEVVLEDSNQNRLNCTLWAEYVDQMMDRVRLGGEAPIMILQLCRGKLYRDVVSISTTYNSTKLILDGDLPEIAEFRTRFYEQADGQSAINTRSVSSLRVVSEDVPDGNDLVRTIQQLRTSGEVGSFWVSARIVAIETTGQWWYLSCPKCFWKISKVQERFYCTNCDRFDATGIPRFKIQVLVQDYTDNVSLLLWDQHCTEIMGKTALELLQDHLQDGESDLFPEEFNRLLDQEIYFKIQVTPEQSSNFYGAYSVKKIKTNMLKTNTLLDENQGSSVASKLQKTEFESEKIESSSMREVKTPLDSVSHQGIVEEMLEDKGVKRKLIDEFSTNALDKKKVFIKKEKE